MNENENTLDLLDLDLHFATEAAYVGFVALPGSWAAMIEADPFLSHSIVSPF